MGRPPKVRGAGRLERMVPGSNWRSQSSRLDDPDGVSARLAQHPEREGYRIEGDSALGALTLKDRIVV